MMLDSDEKEGTTSHPSNQNCDTKLTSMTFQNNKRGAGAGVKEDHPTMMNPNIVTTNSNNNINNFDTINAMV